MFTYNYSLFTISSEGLHGYQITERSTNSSTRFQNSTTLNNKYQENGSNTQWRNTTNRHEPQSSSIEFEFVAI